MTQKLFCFGYGYTADHLVQALRTSDPTWTMAGTTRDLEKQELMDRSEERRVGKECRL